ncbi:hypothetical protein BC827DRAFT_1199219 [Russula dissimulans]|nr:hypothetical protein BC827DRAFT_1199219 [Russula dissimulans]
MNEYLWTYKGLRPSFLRPYRDPPILPTFCLTSSKLHRPAPIFLSPRPFPCSKGVATASWPLAVSHRYAVVHASTPACRPTPHYPTPAWCARPFRRRPQLALPRPTIASSVAVLAAQCEV